MTALDGLAGLMEADDLVGCTGDAPFPVPFTCFWGSQDRRITQQMVLGWQDFTSCSFSAHQISGHHLWPFDREAKVHWLATVADGLLALKL